MPSTEGRREFSPGVTSDEIYFSCREMSTKTLTYNSSNCGLSYSFLTLLMETHIWHRDRKMNEKYLEAQYVIFHQL